MLIGEAVLRSNPDYDLVPLERLPPAERDALAEETDGRQPPYGLLRPVASSSLEPRVASTDTALLFLTLTTPGPCPTYLRLGLADQATSALGRLILDGILEVEVRGEFKSGAAGWAPFAPIGSFAADDVSVHRGGRTAELSIEALRYGQSLIELGTRSGETIAARLYMYGRQPDGPALRRRVAANDPVGAADAALRSGWIENRRSPADSPWRSWRPKRARPGRPSARTTFKLYVSPTADTLPAAVRAVATTLADAPGVLGFKVASTVDGVGRPDKMVAYFADLAELHAGANRIQDEVPVCRPHGVAFTAGVTSDGLLSWAIDPPRTASDRAGTTQPSWRTWVATRLADYLLDARQNRDATSGEPWQLALARLRLDGVDTTSWVPDAGLFDAAGKV